MGCSAAAPDLTVIEDEVAATAVEDGGRVFQSLTVQSSALERSRSPRSTGPRAG